MTYWTLNVRLLLWAFHIVLSQCDGSQYIAGIPEYKSLRDCGKWCYNNLPGDPVDVLGCQQNNVDSCFCRVDLQSQAESSLSFCVKSACDSQVDVTMALNAYSVYCTDRGFTRTAEPPPTPIVLQRSTTMPTPVETDRPIATVTAVIEKTVISEPSSASSKEILGSEGGGLSRSDRIALGTGLGIPLLGILITILIWRHPRKIKDSWRHMKGPS
ncbi:hypothetical protein BKA66DRAFT_576057 [Pyrenochaeta sp. MPI-SDFR-AT-0127]|nr:hypothetical protein BKA66DRAFT_576057 [Pyrenochaeta sp. MPI-SDFR-AT-0127]